MDYSTGTVIRGVKRRCLHIVDGEKETNGLSYDVLVSPIHDGSFMSDLFTAPKFGCVNWQLLTQCQFVSD